MRNLLAFVAAMVLTVGAVGWYLGWYQIGTNKADPAHPRVTIDINAPKIGSDLHRLEEKVEKKVAEHAQQTTADVTQQGASVGTIGHDNPSAGSIGPVMPRNAP